MMVMWRYRLIVVVGVLSASCLATACGSSNSQDELSPLAHKAQFIKEADAVCTEIASDREAAAVEWRKEFSGGQEEANDHLEEGFREIVAPSWSKEAEKLEELVPPETDQAMVTRLIGILSDASHDLEEGGDPKKVLAASLPQFEREAKAFGFDVCSRPI
jgi:hypothetical protein